MRQFIIAIWAFVSLSSAWAEISIDPLLNKVTLQLNAEQWVTTKTALVTTGINASVSDIGLDKVQAQVLDKLNKLSNKGEWHIVSFERSQDKSGLERVQIAAQARIPNNELAGLRDKAKAISKPGETYTIDNVQFTPSEDEIREANNALRNNIYNQAKAELDRLNKNYPDQKYYLHDVNFINVAAPYPVANALYMKAANEVSAPAGASPLAVGNKLNVSATIVLAANPNADLAKLLQH